MNGKGRIANITDNTGSTAYTYDLHGRMTSKTQVTNGQTLLTSYDFTTDGKLNQIVYPSGMTVNYVYTLAKVSGLKINGQTVMSNMVYDPFGPLNQWTWSNGSSMSRNYDLDGQLDTYTQGNTNMDINYYPSGNIQTIADVNNAANNQSFTYDNLYRLDTYNGNGQTIDYDYDASGNRNAVTIDGQRHDYTIDNESNQLQKVDGYSNSHDAIGNMTWRWRLRSSFAYDARGRLVEMSTSNGVNGIPTYYTVNALGLRVAKETGETL